MRTPFALLLLFVFSVGSFVDATPAIGQVTRVDLAIVESPALGGESFGDAGAYERLRGTFHGELDPADPRNAIIVDIELAPRNGRGKVEYATTVEIYRPIDRSRWNGMIHHTVPNRGGAVRPDIPLLEQGVAFVQVGWQGDLAPTERNVVPMLPIARNPDGSPVIDTAYEEWIFEDDDTLSIETLTYAAASLRVEDATLTVRRNRHEPAQTPPDLTWRYLSEDRVEIRRPAGFDGGAIYEFVYQAKDPIVMGIGFAAVRDAISFLRYESSDEYGTRNPLGPPTLTGRAVSYGSSQSGRFLRDMLYLGFNEDLEGRIVFDGIQPHIAGSRKTFTNYRFSQPGRWQKQHEDHLYPGDQFPFTYTTLTDPLTGRTDGLFVRCLASGTCPKVIHTDGEAEIWQARASLVVTDPTGNPIELPENVRVYLIAGTQHGGGGGVHDSQPSFGRCQNLSDPMPVTEIRRALTVALHQWVDGVEPPPSRFPTIQNGGLVSPEQLLYSRIPGVRYTGSVNPLRVNDHSTIPPRQGAAYAVLVGRVDNDGNMVDGVRHPDLAVPLGTFTGWNLRREGFAADQQCAGTGSFIPFAETRAEREATGDPRLSLEERYGPHYPYLTALERAAAELVEQRLLLPEDAAAIVAAAQQDDPSN